MKFLEMIPRVTSVISRNRKPAKAFTIFVCLVLLSFAVLDYVSSSHLHSPQPLDHPVRRALYRMYAIFRTAMCAGRVDTPSLMRGAVAVSARTNGCSDAVKFAGRYRGDLMMLRFAV